MINTDNVTGGSNWNFDFSDSNIWENTTYMTISCEEYYKLVEKAKKWDNFMKMVDGNPNLSSNQTMKEEHNND